MKRSKSNCILPCFRWNVLVFFISGFLFCWCSNRFSFGATSFSALLQSRTADWGPLDGSLERWAYQPQKVPGRDAVRLWGLLSQRKTNDKTVALDRSCVSGICFQIVSFSVQRHFLSYYSRERQIGDGGMGRLIGGPNRAGAPGRGCSKDLSNKDHMFSFQSGGNQRGLRTNSSLHDCRMDALFLVQKCGAHFQRRS